MTKFIIKFRWFIIATCLLLGAGFGALIPLAKTDPEIRNYVPSGMSSRVATDKIEKEFGVQDMIVILFSDSSILSAHNLLQIRDIDRDISRLNGISGRISPFTIKSIKGEDGMMVADPLIKRIPKDSSETGKLKESIIENRFARDIVFSYDMTTASITATINSDEDESVTLHRIDSVISSHPGRAEILTGGLPYIRQYIMKDVRRDGLILIPVALLIMLIILKFTLGDWRSVMMPFTVVVLSTAISMGLISLLGWKISILSLLVPIILVAVANNYGIYLVARHQEIIGGWKGSKNEILTRLTGSLNMPILFSGLTTVAGILGLLTHSIIPARQVGILAATGVTMALVMSLTFIPALIFIRGSGKKKINPKRVKKGVFDKLSGGLSGIIVRHPGRILIISAGLTVLLSLGMIFLRIDTNQENYFPHKHPVRLASGIINNKFGGSQTISIMVNGDIKDPLVMKSIDNLTIQLEKQDGVGKVFSISQVVREMSKAIYTKDEEEYDRIPNTENAIAQMFELYNMSGDQNDFKQLMNLDNTKAHILIRLSKPENKVINDVRQKIHVLTSGFPAKVTVGGYAIIMADFAGSIIKGQISSLLFAVITVLILLSIIFKSFKGGLTGSIPLIASILILFGFMGITGMALDAATALLSSIMIGVGVDFTIQFMWCFNIELRKGLTHEEAAVSTLATIGRSIIINALSVMAGFSALMFSGFTSIRFFGYLVLISIGSCLIGAIVIIPAFLIKFKPRFISFDLNNRKNRNNEKRISFLAFLLPLLPVAAQLPDATQIMKKSRDLTITGSMSSNISLTITEKGGSIRNRTISMITKSYPDGSEKRLIRFIEPADVRGTALLIIDNKNIPDEMWIYLPALKKTRRIVSSDKGKSFMSSEFSNSDMSSPTLSDFTYKHLDGSGENKQWLIESSPINNDKAEEYGYSKKISWFSSDTWQLIKMEYYNFDNQLFKTIEIKAILPFEDGRYTIKNMIAKNISNGRSSEILLDKIVTNTKIEDTVFSLQKLER